MYNYPNVYNPTGPFMAPRTVPFLGQRLIRKYKAPDRFAEGWFEDTARYMQPDPDEDTISKPPTPQRKSKARA
jgi:hypothetical protein